MEAGIRFWSALVGSIRVKKVLLSEGFLQLSKRNNVKNFSSLLHSNDSSVKTEKKAASRIDFASVAYKLIDKILDQIPEYLSIQNFDLRVVDESIEAGISVVSMRQQDEEFQAEISSKDNRYGTQRWELKGIADPGNKKADIHFYNLDTGKVILPYIGQRFNLIAGFDSVHLELDEVKYSKGQLHISGQSGISSFLINHPKIAKKDVVVDKANVNYHFILDEHFLSLDSTTTASFNTITMHPFVKLDMEKDTVFSLSAVIPRMKAQDFISSLPEGLFNHFKGMEVKGEFDYRLDFQYNENRPKDLVFESSLHKYNLAITRYGEANLDKLNGEFTYVPIEKGRPQRPIFVGAANPNYTPVDQISPYLQKCVLTTEDPSFFYHRGFIDEAFRQSIIKNIRTKKFARGASTISMQLVKNVFLTREKTMSRKLEEILLVYILENNRICPKQRMLEVYFNIIEWGPNVYGIGEASEFYFRKRPSQLTYDECLFLATIIPRPKGFMWRFDKEGKLKPFAIRQNTFLTKLMLMRNVLTASDTLQIKGQFEISGPAKGFIKINPDTIPIDTIIINENGIIQEVDE